MKNQLAGIKCFIFDMDGTIYLGKNLLPGAVELFHFLDQNDMPYYFLTNNSSRSRMDYVEKLTAFGLPAHPDNILTSGEATAIHIQSQFPGARVYLVGTPSLMEEFKKFGFTLTDKSPDLAVLGYDTTLTYKKLEILCNFVSRGIPYIATHPDINCPAETGFAPDIGSFIALIKASTGRSPDVIVGKPHAPIIDAILEKTGFAPDQILMVGDRLYTDIAMGSHGLKTALVLSGEAKVNDIARSPHKPDFVFNGLPELRNLILQVD